MKAKKRRRRLERERELWDKDPAIQRQLALHPGNYTKPGSNKR